MQKRCGPTSRPVLSRGHRVSGRLGCVCPSEFFLGQTQLRSRTPESESAELPQECGPGVSPGHSPGGPSPQRMLWALPGWGCLRRSHPHAAEGDSGIVCVAGDVSLALDLAAGHVYLVVPFGRSGLNGQSSCPGRWESGFQSPLGAAMWRHESLLRFCWAQTLLSLKDASLKTGGS